MVDHVNRSHNTPSTNPLPSDMRERAQLEASETVNASLRPRIAGKEIDEAKNAFEDSDYSLKEAHDVVPIGKGSHNEGTRATTKAAMFSQKAFRTIAAHTMSPHPFKHPKKK